MERNGRGGGPKLTAWYTGGRWRERMGNQSLKCDSRNRGQRSPFPKKKKKKKMKKGQGFCAEKRKISKDSSRKSKLCITQKKMVTRTQVTVKNNRRTAGGGEGDHQ